MQSKSKALRNSLKFWQKMLVTLFLLIVGILMMIPMWNVIVLSTSPALYASQSGVVLWWRAFSIEGFSYIFRVAKLGRSFFNSFFVTTVATTLQVLFSSIAGYVLIQKDMPLRKFITSFVMITMMIPADLTMISIYQLNKSLNFLNTYSGLIINGLISGFSILLMKNYFASVNYTISESARIDGASELRIFWQMFMPISLPGLATVFFMEYVARWNTITIPATILTQESMYTLPLKLKQLIMNTTTTSSVEQIPANAIMAAIVITALPLLVIYIFAQRFLLSGLNLGSSKE